MPGEATFPNDRLRSARHRKEWTQSELAEVLGTDFETVSRWERGVSVPSSYYRQKLCEVLDTTAAELGLLSQKDESLPPLDSPFVFFSSSYADAEHEFVIQCKAVLQAHKMTVWDDRLVGRRSAENRRTALREAIHAAHVVLLIVSPEARSSRHVRNALQLARMYNRPVCLVWIAGDHWQQCVPEDGKGQQSIVDARNRDQQAAFNEIITRLEENWGTSHETTTQASVPVEPLVSFEPRNPYKGLRAFHREDKGDFFGRDSLIDELAAALERSLHTEQANAQDARLLAVLGPSGSGKSSIVMAGLLPQLQAGKLPGSEQWVYLDPLVPGVHPIEALARVLAPHFPEKSQKVLCEDLEGESTRGVHRLATTLTRHQETRVVLFVDQCEELFTLTSTPEERQQFLDLLVTAVTEPTGPVIVILTLRADFYDRVLSTPPLGKLIRNHQHAVLPMETNDLRAVIERPAALPDVQLTFEGDLVGDLLLDLFGQVGALPLLQFTLDQLFHQRSGSLLTLQAYQEMGGVKGAIVNQAESTYAGLHSEEHRRLVRALFLRLIDPGMSERDITRRRVSRAELSLPESKQTALLQEVADAFIAARLLTANQVAGTSTIEVSHEALIREWPRLLDWVREGREDIHLQQIVSQDAAAWERRGNPKERLYRGSQLKEAQAWARRNLPNSQEVTFLRKSAAQQLWFVASVIAILLLLASSLGIAGWFVLHQPPSKTLVTMLQDSDTVAGSLRWCINNAPSGSTITFAQDVSGGIIELTGGDLVFPGGKQLTIDGPGTNQLTISNGDNNAKLHVSKQAMLNISGLSFKSSETVNDAFIFNEGTLTISSSIISGNKTTTTDSATNGFGGSIYNSGTLTVTDNTIISNNSISGTALNFGGGIYNSGKLTLVKSIVSHNEATGSGGDSFGTGGGIFNDSTGTINVTSSVISDNKASSAPGPLLNAGGGIENEEGGTLTVTNSTFSGNLVTGNPVAYGGGISSNGKLTVTHSIFLNNTANSSSDKGFGGGINSGGTVMVTDSTFSGNSASGKQASSGGGIRNEVKGKLSVIESTFSKNSASSSDSFGFGGGISNGGTVMVTDGTFSGNSASGKQGGTGGSIANTGKLSVTESTFSKNSANSYGGGIISGAKGSSAIIRFCTIYRNTANAGGGIWVDPTGSSQMTLSDSIIAANSAPSGPDISGAVISGGYNLIENTAGATGLNANDKQVALADLKIDPTLRDNEGSTHTLALLQGSKAIDDVPLQACSITITDPSSRNLTITTDQRGDRRPDGSEEMCDSGAYESSY